MSVRHPLELAPEVNTPAEQRLGGAVDRIKSLEDQLAERERTVADLEQALQEAHVVAEKAREEAGALNERRAFQDRVLADVLHSLSWRLTKPLRALKR